MYNVKNPIRFQDQSLIWRVVHRLQYIGKTMIILIFVVMTYNIINFVAILALNLDSTKVFLPGEPILFGIFYMIYFLLIDSLSRNIRKRMKEIEQ
jgi:hypothetical protein